jgi:uncharacterized protein (DUF885 family)
MGKPLLLLAGLLIFSLLLWTACRGSLQPARPSGGSGKGEEGAFPLAKEAVAGVQDRALAALLGEHWDWTLHQAPVWATTLGDHRFDAELGHVSHQAVLEARAARRKFLARARALPREQMSRADSITLDLFIGELDAEVEREVCDFHLWSVSAYGNAAVAYSRLHEEHKVATPADGENLSSRYRQIARNIDDEIANLRRGAAIGLFSTHESVRRALEMIDGQLAKPVEKWTLYEPAKSAGKHGWRDEQASAFTAAITETLHDSVRPAVARYRRVLAEEILPRARGLRAEGLGALPNGEACYRASIKSYVSLPYEPNQLHALGQSEIARINGEMRALGKKLFATDDLAEVVQRLRSDRSLYFSDREQIMAAASEALAAARARIPDFFGILPRTEVVVAEIPEYEAPYTTIAYYRPPHFDGSKPGEYFVNTFKPEVRPRYEMQVLAFHESIPGHHLQIAISMERGALPAFRRFGGNTAFVEGWALYTERLAEEMGLYSGDLDRLGMLSYEAWRASRLVVDTGVHALGWTREQAERFMLEHTALTKENIVNEVDRYISWPGQALAYKVGQLEILALRKQAEEALGARFDLRAFHDAVLENGAVTMPVLRAIVKDWVRGKDRG